MSDALEYLVKARPEAMGHYLAFLKASGRSLDPKTRALISVITKVHAQTERGLRQYLKRALREGCTPDEVLDALLRAALLGYLAVAHHGRGRGDWQPAEPPAAWGERLSLRDYREVAEKQYIVATLDEVAWNISRASQLLGVERTNLHKKMRAYGIRRDDEA